MEAMILLVQIDTGQAQPRCVRAMVAMWEIGEHLAIPGLGRVCRSMSMPNYLTSICPHCGRTLRVRSEYLGRMVTCNHCDHPFLAGELHASRSARLSGETPAPAGSETPATRPAEPWETGTRQEVERLQDELEAFRQRLEWAKGVEEELESSRKENGRLATTIQVLKTELFERVTQVDRLQRSAEDLITVRAERDQSDLDLQAAREESKQLGARLDDAERTCQQWERSFEESECRHRSEIDGLAQELRIAGTQAALARQRERALTEQREIATQELDDLTRQVALGDPRTLQETVEALGQELDATRIERDQLADKCVESDLALRLLEDQHRDQRDSLLCELQEARRWEEIAVERETELLGQIQGLRRALDLCEQKIEDQHRANQEESTALARELEAMFRQQMADECLGRAVLQEQFEALQAELEQLRQRSDEERELVEILQRQRDDAMEQAGMLRLDRDRLYGSLARLEARVQEVEEENRTDILQRASKAGDDQCALEAENHRETNSAPSTSETAR